MKESEYRRTPEKELVGRRVKSLKPFRNGLFVIPAGIVFKIERKHGGFHLITEPCSKCGISAFISKVQPCEIELL